MGGKNPIIMPRHDQLLNNSCAKFAKTTEKVSFASICFP